VTMEEVEGKALEDLIQDEDASVVIYFCETPLFLLLVVYVINEVIL